MAEDKKAEDAKDKKAPAKAKAETTAAKKPRKRVATKAKETEEVAEEAPVAKKAEKVEEAKVEAPVAEEAAPVVEATEEVAEEVVVKKAEPRKPAVRPVDFDWGAIGKKEEVYAEKERAELEAMYDATLSQVNVHDVLDAIIIEKTNKIVQKETSFKNNLFERKKNYF